MNEVTMFDDFADDAHLVREAVIRGGFASKRGPDGADYTGISMYPVNHWFDEIASVVGKPIAPKLSCFRLNLEGELPHSWVHSDDICAKFASVLYLNTPPQCIGGTAFWKHRQLDIDRLPSRETLAAAKVDADVFYEGMSKDWKNLSLWEHLRTVPMRWNRFITYPTSLFHSRYPFEGFGKGPADGRLIWICFYDLGA